MPSDQIPQPEFVDGPIMDYRRIGAYLNVPAELVRTWAARKKKGETGIPALLPDPIGEVAGKPVWRVPDIVAFRAAYLAHERRGGRRPSS